MHNTQAKVVAADEKEGGVRATLNLGHTFGHAMETGQGYGVWLHGEAVSAGMVMAADMSYRLVRQSPMIAIGACCPPAPGQMWRAGQSLTDHAALPPFPFLCCHRQGWIEKSILDRTRALLECAKLPVRPPKGMTPAQFKDLMAVDKKVLSGKLRLILLKGPLGGCVFTGDFDPSKLDETLAAFCH